MLERWFDNFAVNDCLSVLNDEKQI